MGELRYEAPTTLPAALALLSSMNGRARILAGGTDLLIQMRSRRLQPELLVDVKRIAELGTVSFHDGQYVVGAAVSAMDLIDDAAFARAWPGVKLIGSVQVRGRATITGNVCNASPAADSVPPLLTACARVRIAGAEGTRELPLDEFITGPGQTCLARGEMVSAFVLPARPARTGDAYLRFTPRTEMDIAVVGAAVNVTLDDSGICTQARVSLGAVAERALVVDDAARALIGTTGETRDLDRLADAAREACRPIDDKRGTKEFRTRVAGVMAHRAARIAFARARENG